MKFISSSEVDDSLLEIAAGVCASEHVDFNSLGNQQVRGIVSFRCTTCHAFYPLTDLIVVRRNHVCKHCKERIRLYCSSNKYGKLRRNIFYRLLDLGIAKVVNTIPRIPRKGLRNRKRITDYAKRTGGVGIWNEEEWNGGVG